MSHQEPEIPQPGKELPQRPDVPTTRKVPTHIFPPEEPVVPFGPTALAAFDAQDVELPDVDGIR